VSVRKGDAMPYLVVDEREVEDERLKLKAVHGKKEEAKYSYGSALTGILDRLENDGWELVAVVPGKGAEAERFILHRK
jgi:hypothetical protein